MSHLKADRDMKTTGFKYKPLSPARKPFVGFFYGPLAELSTKHQPDWLKFIYSIKFTVLKPVSETKL